MFRPWQRVEWVSALTPTECLERLTKAGISRDAGSSADALTTVVSAANAVRTSFATAPWWRGHPYFKGTVVESREGTTIVGRLNPDLFAIGALVFGFWTASQFVSGLVIRGVEPIQAYLAQLVQTAAGVGFFVVLVLAIGVATVRSLQWRQESARLATAIQQACEASR